MITRRQIITGAASIATYAGLETLLRADAAPASQSRSLSRAMIDVPLPKSIAMAPDGTWYAVSSYDLVVHLNAEGEILHQWGQTGELEGEFDWPLGIAIAPGGDVVYVTDRNNYRVQAFSPDGTFLFSWGAIGGSADGDFIDIHGIDVGPDGTVYVSDYTLDRLQAFSPDGTFLQAWQSKENNLNTLVAVSVAPDGSVYALDAAESGVVHFGADGTILNTWSEESLVWPYGMAVAPDGSIYVTDCELHQVFHFTAEGDLIKRWGEPGYAKGKLYLPYDIVVAADSTVYVADGGNSRIQHFDAEGNLLDDAKRNPLDDAKDNLLDLIV